MRYLTIDCRQLDQSLTVVALFTTTSAQQQIKHIFNLRDDRLQARPAPRLTVTKATRKRYGEFLDLAIHQLQPPTTKLRSDVSHNWLNPQTLRQITQRLFSLTDVTEPTGTSETMRPIGDLSSDDLRNLIGFFYRTDLFNQPLNLTACYTVNFNLERK